MCWSLEASITAFVVAMGTAAFLLYRGTKTKGESPPSFAYTMGILLLSYGTMQLWEALIWSDQKGVTTESCGVVNKIGTNGAYFALWTHALAVGLGLYFDTGSFIPLIVGAVIALGSLVCYPWNTGVSCTGPKSGKSNLVWGFNPGFYMLIFAACMLFCWIYLRPWWKSLAISMLYIVSFALSYFAAGSQRVGSYWCFVAAAFSPVLIALTYV